MPAEQSGTNIAIVGMALRVPGAASVEKLWADLRSGMDNVRCGPVNAAGVRVNAGAALERIEEFDPSFFGLSVAEAEIMDPQQRVFLECSWEALEDAGFAPEMHGTRVGVFAGCSLSTYLLANIVPSRGFSGRPDELQEILGNDKDYLSTRVSYLLNLTGPSVGIQTACSTSLVAVHMACQSLLNGECDLALAGGATIRVPQDGGYRTQEGGYLSPSGQCRPFDADADGAIFGNGAGCVVLRRIEDAVVDRDRVYAVIRGSAINNDGSRKAGFTAPSVEGQSDAILEALSIAGVSPAEIGSVEAHGTGTQLGDSIESAALQKAFREFTARQRFCAIQSIKANVGHLECAAGIAGLIKSVLAVHRGELPPQIGFEKLNPNIPSTGPFYVNEHVTPWTDSPRRAAVSSFGIGGTNAHVVLEEAPPVEEQACSRETTQGLPAMVLPVSARSRWSLEKLRGAYVELLGREDCDAAAICGNAALRRGHHPLRLAVCGENPAELVERLEAWRQGEEETSPARLVLVFGGQGGQWAGMGEQLRQQEPVYGRQWELCRAALLECGGRDLGEGWEDVAGTQAGVWALQCSLSELWRSWGMRADAVLGHSMGEVAAAWASGALTLEQSARVMAVRGELLQQRAGQGGMLAVESSGEPLQELLEESGGELEVAARNAPHWTVLAGTTAALEQLAARLGQRGIGQHRLHTNGVAGHSRQMDALCGPLQQKLHGLRAGPLHTPMLSTVSGEWLQSAGLGPDYWARNLRQPVEFERSVRRLLREGYGLLLEIGPHPQLRPALETCAEAENVQPVLMHSLRRQQGERREMLEALAQLYVRGRSPRWRALYPRPLPVTQLPLYPWNRQRCWINAPAVSTGGRHAEDRLFPDLPLQSSMEPNTYYWQRDISLDSLPWARDHKVAGEAIVPAAAYIEAVSAAFEELEGECPGIERLNIIQALPLQPGSSCQLQMVLKKMELGDYEYRISSRPVSGAKAQWQTHASGHLRSSGAVSAAGTLQSIAEIQDRCTKEIGEADHYAALASSSIEYGRSFRLVRRVRCRPAESLAEITAPATWQAAGMRWPVGWLDGLLQALHPLLRGTWLPVSFQNVHLPLECGHVYVNARLLDEPRDGTARFALQVFSPRGELLGKFDSIELRRLDSEPAYCVEWLDDRSTDRRSVEGRFLLLDDSLKGHGLSLERELQTQGQPAVRARPDAAAIDSIATSEWRAVVYLAPEMAGFQEDACSKALTVIQRAALSRASGPLRLYLVTANVHTALKADEPTVSGAMLWGLRRTAAIEYPHLRIAAIDIGSANDVPALAQELLSYGFEEEAALCDGRRSVARLARAEAVPGRKASAPLQLCQPDSLYIITGAFGGLGLLSAEWLAAKGAQHLALIARRAAGAAVEQRLNVLRKQGVSVNVFVADVSSREELGALIGQIRATLPPVRGAIHAAGVLNDGLIENLTAEQFRKVLGVKAGGAWYLHEFLAGCPLDWFVLYSSAAALLGAPGQANHAAANAFLDALAHCRHGLGLPALSINWGPWAAHGAIVGDRLAFLEQRGWAPITAAQAFQAMETFLANRTPQAAMFQLDFHTWQRYYPDVAHSRFLASLNGRTHSPAIKVRSRTAQETQAFLVEQAADVLRCPLKTIDPTRPLREFGLDSLRALELRNRIQAALGIHLPATIMWRYPVISALSRHIHELARQTQKP